MHREIFAPDTERLWHKIKEKNALPEFYLAGGTALALHFGHRLSIDLDFFSAADFDTKIYKEKLVILGSFSLTREAEATIDGTLDGVKISLLGYRYPLLFPASILDGVAVADPRDIARMKLDAISSRGSKNA
jgi:hypothetical protein